MASYQSFRFEGFEGEFREGISLEKLKEFLNWPRCSQDWTLLRRVSSHGTWTYKFKADLGDGEREYFIKVFNKREMYDAVLEKMFSRRGLRKPWRYPKRLLSYLFYPIPVKVGFEKGKILLEKKIPTAPPVAYLYKRGIFFGWGFLITEKIPQISAENFAEYLKGQRSLLPPAQYLMEKRALLKELARLISQLMKLNFFLPDLRISNVLVEKMGEGGFRLWVIDLVEAVEEKPSEKKMLYHLIANPYYAQLFTGTDKIRFLKWYLSFSGLKKEWAKLCEEVNPLLKAWWKKWYEKYQSSSTALS